MWHLVAYDQRDPCVNRVPVLGNENQARDSSIIYIFLRVILLQHSLGNHKQA